MNPAIIHNPQLPQYTANPNNNNNNESCNYTQSSATSIHCES